MVFFAIWWHNDFFGGKLGACQSECANVSLQDKFNSFCFVIMQDRSSGGHNLEYDKTTTHILNIWKQYDSILCINEILIEPEHNVEIASRD